MFKESTSRGFRIRQAEVQFSVILGRFKGVFFFKTLSSRQEKQALHQALWGVVEGNPLMWVAPTEGTMVEEGTKAQEARVVYSLNCHSFSMGANRSLITSAVIENTEKKISSRPHYKKRICK